MRGNASEIASLADNTTNMGGVDSLELGRDVMLAAAKKLALKYQTIVAVSGPVDYVRFHFSHSMHQTSSFECASKVWTPGQACFLRMDTLSPSAAMSG